MSSWSRTLLALTVAVSVFAVIFLGSPVAAAEPAPSTVQTQTNDSDIGDIERTIFEIDLDTAGDARVGITAQLSVPDDETAEAAFWDLAAAFEDGEVHVGIASLEHAADAVDESVDREMDRSPTVRSASLSGDGENQTGNLTAEFTWGEFGYTDGDSLSIDDAFTHDDDLWLPALLADQYLVIRAPAGYGVVDATVPARDGELHWAGPVDFEPGDLHATFVGNAGNGNGDENGDGATDDTEDDQTSTDLSAVALAGLLVAAGILLVAVLLVGTNRGSRLRTVLVGGAEDTDDDGSSATRGSDADSESGGPPADSGDSEADGRTGATVPAGNSIETGQEDEGTASTTAENTGQTVPTDGRPDSPGPDHADGEGPESATESAHPVGAGPGDIDEELLSDEERVERLLQQNGGRMKQADIVRETDWSNAKVSQLLSSMNEDGQIDKLRIGRENLISFPDVDITDSDGGGEGGQ